MNVVVLMQVERVVVMEVVEELVSSKLVNQRVLPVEDAALPLPLKVKLEVGDKSPLLLV